jgi:hypothetical protein
MKLAKRKQAWLNEAPTETLERIMSTLFGPELLKPSEEYPKGGVVSIEGLGEIPTVEIQAELARRIV